MQEDRKEYAIKDPLIETGDPKEVNNNQEFLTTKLIFWEEGLEQEVI